MEPKEQHDLAALMATPRSWYTNRSVMSNIRFNLPLNSDYYAEENAPQTPQGVTSIVCLLTNVEQVCYGSESKLNMRVDDSNLSKSFPLGLKNEGRVEVTDSSQTGRLYLFSVHVEPAPGRFWRTGLVSFYSAFVLVNHTGMATSATSLIS